MTHTYTLYASVANCLVGGESTTQYGTRWLRDTITFKCGGRSFVLRQVEAVAQRKIQPMRGQFAETSEIRVEQVAAAKVNAVLADIEKLCWLLSFATMAHVVRYAYSYAGKTHVRTAHGTAEHFRPVFPIASGASIRSFIEQTYPEYTRLERSRRINTVIHYLLAAERPDQPLECRLVLMLVALENLKESYARSKAIPFLKGSFRAGPGPRDRKFSFEDLLSLMLKDVGMRPGLKRLIKFRNSILHTGVYPAPFKVKWRQYERMQDLVREYLLRLLGYKGAYFSYGDPNLSKYLR